MGKSLTSVDVVLSAAQSRRGRTLMRNWGLTSTSSCASSASLGCSGKDADEDLQVLTAQVRKFMLRTFILLKMIYFLLSVGAMLMLKLHMKIYSRLL